MFKTYKFTFFFFIYLLILSLYPVSSSFNCVVILSILSLLLLLNICSRLNKYVYAVILFIFSFIITVHGVYAFVYGNQVGYTEIEIMMLTNMTESKGMLSTIIIPILISTVLSFGLTFLSGMELKKLKLSNKKIFIFIGIFFLAFVGDLTFKLVQDKDFHFREAKLNKRFFTYYYLRRTNPLIYTPIYSGILYYHELKEFEKIRQQPKVRQEGISLNDSIETEKRRIFVILGESLNRKYMSLYGYEKQKTTPFLDGLASDSTVNIQYYDGISGANYTNRALPFIITASTPHAWTEHLKYKTAIDLANDLNYKTFWISNQPSIDLFNATVNGNEPTNLGVTTEHYYFAPTEKYLDDLDLIDDYIRIQKENKDSIGNELVLFHLRGSHQPYSEGFDDEDSLDGGQDLNTNTINYNRTVRHTDRFVEKLYNNIDKDRDIIIFVSDHGEIVGVGHHCEFLVKDQYDVPLVIINNDNEDYTAFLNRFVGSDGIVSTHSVYYLLSYMMGYNVSDALVSKAKSETKDVLNLIKLYDYDTFD